MSDIKQGANLLNHAIMKPNNWIPVDGDIDYTTEIRLIRYPVNRRNTTRLNKFVRECSRRIPVYSQYDCTGQVCGIYYKLAKMGRYYYIIERSVHFDY
jgi:hypothetical protein